MTYLPIVNNYAKSLFAISSKNNALDNDKELLELVLNIFQQEQKLYRIFLNPVIGYAKKVALLDVIFSNLKPSTYFYNFIKILTKNHRMYLFEIIVKKFIDLIHTKQNIIYAKLSTARIINNEELNTIKLFMDKKYNCTFQLNASVNPSLVGGLVLEFDNKILDASIATMINKLEISSIKAISNI